MQIDWTDEKFVLAQGEIKAFSLTVKSEEDIALYAELSGAEGGCLSSEGRDYLGNEFKRAIELKATEEKKLWFYVKAPEKAGETSVVVAFYKENGERISTRNIALITTDAVADDAQFNDIYSLRRLVWLNSDYAIDDEIPAPFLPVSASDKTIGLFGRELAIGSLGLPSSINSYFTQGIKVESKATEILSDAMRFEVSGQAFENRRLRIESKNDKAVIFSENDSKDFFWTMQAEAEFDGFVSYKMTLTAKRAVTADDIRLTLPVSGYCRKYFMGLGRNGGLFDGKLDWKWNEKKQQDGFWTGNVNAGLKIQFKAENYRKPLVNIYYAHKPLRLPDSWANDGKGGIRFEDDEFIAYTGEKTFAAGEQACFSFSMLITPIKEIDLKKQLQMRLYHKLDGQPEEWFQIAKEKGANMINVHHGNDLNPYINYPFFESAELAKFVETAHAEGIKVKIYYTIRELTINTPEFSAFRDLGYEIFEKPKENVDGEFWQSEAKDWIRNHIGEDVIPAWRQVLRGKKYKDEYDSSVITNGCSRLCNFYIEGLRNLLSYADLDGLYIDDVAYDRDTMKRVRKVLDEREGRYIDFHTWNHNFDDLAGNTSCAYLYAELFPYIDKLWIGEGFDYDSSPDFWLVEMSGIPFGLMSEMLEANWQKANQWKGLVFGMTTRLGWTDVENRADPSNLWRIFDEYNLGECEMLGFWNERNEVECDQPEIKATLYKLGRKRYIALANFSEKDVRVKISIKGSEKYSLYCPFIDRFQKEQTLGNETAIPKNQGLFIVVQEK
ncbi:MAG: hypothetical protein IJ506_00900 [Clostridia bacterium]|nr:hypothetical protein [Clostridia bacterium]